MNTYRNIIITSSAAAALLILSTSASARFADTPWQLFELPRLHTNQDGMIKGGAIAPHNPWDVLAWDDIKVGGPDTSLLGAVIDIQADGKPKGGGLGPYPLSGNWAGGSAGSPDSGPGGPGMPGGSPVPAPGVLTLLGVAGLCGRRRRR